MTHDRRANQLYFLGLEVKDNGGSQLKLLSRCQPRLEGLASSFSVDSRKQGAWLFVLRAVGQNMLQTSKLIAIVSKHCVAETL